MANLSVCLSVTRWYCTETNAHIVKYFTSFGSAMTLVFWGYRRYKYPRGTPSYGPLNKRGFEKFVIFDRNRCLSRRRYYGYCGSQV